MNMKKPHVCFISESQATYGILTGQKCDKVGGAEVQQTVLASELLKLGYTISFAVGDFGQEDKIVTAQGITLVKIHKLRTYPIPGPAFFDEITRTHKAMKRADADIYYQRAGGHITGIAALYGRMYRKPFVFSVAHNNDIDGSSGTRFSRHYNHLYQYGLRRATCIVLQTDDQAGLLEKNLSRTGVLIRSTFGQPPDEEIGMEKCSALWVGNFKKIKRPEMFLNLTAKLPQYKFVMVGGSGEGEESLMPELVKKGESIPNLRIVGAVPYKEVGKYFGQARVFVNTSLDEGFPNTYLQAWSRGTPVIGTFDADNLIKRYDLGRYCENMDALAKSVDEYMKDDTLWSAASERVKAYVRENHSPERVAAKYDELFTNLVKS